MTVAGDERDLLVGFDTSDATVSVASHIVDGWQIGPIPRLVVAKIVSAYVGVSMMRAVDTAVACACPYFARYSHGILESHDTSFGWDGKVGWRQPSTLRTEERFVLAVFVRS